MDEYGSDLTHIDVGRCRLELGDDRARRAVLLHVRDGRDLSLSLLDPSRNDGHGRRPLRHRQEIAD